MFEFIANNGIIEQFLAALIVLLFTAITILRIYLICPFHASLKEYLASKACDKDIPTQMNNSLEIIHDTNMVSKLT